MKPRSENALAAAQSERDKLCEECFQLLHQISRRPGCIKLLNLAREHLRQLAQYKAGRGRQRGSG